MVVSRASVLSRLHHGRCCLPRLCHDYNQVAHLAVSSSCKVSDLEKCSCWLCSSLGGYRKSSSYNAFVNGSHVTFDFIVFDCHFNIFSSAWNWIMPTVVVLSFVVPTTLVVISTAYLLYVAYRIAVRGRETLKWQGLTTTILTATVYCMSVLPNVAGCIIGSRAGNLNSSFQLHFNRVAVSCQTLNTISNIYIYCLTVPSFRQFLWSRIRFMYSSRTNISLRPNQGPR